MQFLIIFNYNRRTPIYSLSFIIKFKSTIMILNNTNIQNTINASYIFIYILFKDWFQSSNIANIIHLTHFNINKMM